MELGKTLREAREAKGMTIGDISARTHMMSQIVDDLEKENFKRIVAPIYGRGFIRMYCEAVGIADVKALQDEFMALYTGKRTSPAKEQPAPAPAPRPAPAPAPAPRAEPVPPRRPDPIPPPPPPPPAPKPAPAPRSYRPPAASAPDIQLPEIEINWRMVALYAIAAVFVAMLAFAVKFLYSATRGAEVAAQPAPVEVTVTPEPAAGAVDTPATPAPVPGAPRVPAKVPALYID